MRKRRVKVWLVSLMSVAMLCSLAACGSEDIDYVDGNTPLGGSQPSSGGEFVTPDDLGYNGDDVNFDLDSPGNPNFDNIGNVPTPDDIEGVGEVGDTGIYDPSNGDTTGDNEQEPGDSEQTTHPNGEENGDDATGGEVELPDMNTPKGEEGDISDDVKLPNTGIFLEDD